MATLIQSKQIQGIVTASVIAGDFSVSGGSVDLSTASGVSGSFSGSYIGDGSGITGIDYSQINNTPIFLPGDNVTITSGSNIITIASSGGGGGSNESLNSFTASYTTDSSSFDSRIIGISASGSGADWNVNLVNIPSGIISGSIQILGGTDIISSSAQITSLGFISSSHTDIDSLNDYTSSNDLRLTNLESTTSSLDTRITQLSDTTSSYETVGRGIISSSQQFPSGIVSSSVQILGGTGILSGSHTDVSSLNTFTSSIQTEVDGLSSATSSYITTLPSGLLSGSHSDLTSLNTFTSSYSTDSSSFDTRISNIGDHANVEHINTFTSSASDRLLNIEAATGSYLTSETDSQTLSIDGNDLTISSGNTITIPGTTIPVGTISGSEQITDLGFISSSHSDVTNLNTFTSSIQTEVDAISSATSSYLTQTPSGTISGSEQVDFDVVTGGKGILSGSKTDIDSLNTFTSSIQTELDAISAATSSYLTSETDSQTLSISGDQLTISSGNVVTIPTGSELPSGLVSSSIQVLGGTGILSGSHSDVTHLNTFTSSVQTEIDGLSSVTSSYLTEIPAGTLSGSEQLPSGLVSSSVQVLGGTGILSGSHSDLTSLNAYTQSNDISISNIENTTSSLEQRVEQIESNTSSYDSQVLGLNDSLNTFSSSIQTEVDGLSTFTGSIQTELDALSAATSSYLTSETDSQTLSIDGNELTISSGNSITLPSTSIPSGVISGSSQLTSSYDARYVINQAPTAKFTNHTTNFNTNLATSGKTMVSMSVSDSESNSPFSASLSGTDGSSFDLVYSNAASSSIGIHAGSNLSAQTYSYNVSIFDSFGKSTTESRTLEVTQADTGTLNGDTTSYIIESANNGATIRDVSGFGGGNASQVSVSYSPNHGSQALASFTSSNPAVLIDSSGNLTMGLALRGSSTGSGDSIVSNISFTDQYSNVGNSNVTINVFANNHPSASISDISGDLNINEATSGTDLVNVTITDTESDTPFSASLSGTHASSFQLQYNNSNSSSIDIQAASDLIAQTYSYTLDIFDNFGKTSSYARTLTIADSDVGTLGTNGTFYIIESATSGNTIRLNSNGRTGTQGDLAVSYSPNQGSQTCSEFTSSNALIAVNSSGNLSVGSNISGSSETSGDTIASNITFIDQYGNIGSGSISVNVTTNNAPDIVFSNSSRLNTNQATGSSGTLTTLSFSDTESDSVDYDNLTFTDSSGQLTATQNSNTWLVTANSQLSASNYTFSAAIEDEHHFRTNTESHTITIVQSGNGTMTGDSSMYIIESAESGDPFRDATGFNNGNTAQIGASYSPSNGSPTIQSFTSSNPAILVNSSGNLTLGVDISGSVTQSGDTIVSNMTFTDQYGNIGSGSVTATVFGNQSPAASFTPTSNYESDNATNGSTAGTLSLSDTEGDNPLVVTLSGTHASSFQVSGTNIQSNTTLSAGTYTINITVTDSYSESITLSNQTITVTQSQDFGKIYIYYSNFGSNAGFSGNYNGLMGADTVNSDTPPEVTAYTGNTASPYYKFKSGDIGTTSISLAGSKNATLAAVVSGSDLNTAISASAGVMSWANGVQTLILYPSGSDMGGIPTSMTDGFGTSTTGRYVLVEYPNGGSAPLGASPSNLQSIVLDSALHGYSEWFVLGSIGQNSGTNMRLKVLAVSGSLGDF